MALIDVRIKCVDFSGRTDLVVDTSVYVDAGMNFFIEAGRKYLDSRVNTENSPAIFSGTLTIGDTTFTFGSCRSIVDVWFINDDGDKIFPKRLTFDQFNEEYPKNSATESKGEPIAWAPNIIRSASTPIVEDNLLKGVIFTPAADIAYGIRIEGQFFSNTLIADADENYWSQLYEDILIYAALYKLEGSYRNTEGKNDWLNMLNDAIFGIDLDIAEQEASGRSQMVG